jgi:hypothetical protein
VPRSRAGNVLAWNFLPGIARPRGQRAGKVFPVHEEHAMEDVTYTKGIYTATAATRPVDGGQYQGLVSLSRDDGEELENSVYEVDGASGTPEEALEEAKALAHRILGELEL